MRCGAGAGCAGHATLSAVDTNASAGTVTDVDGSGSGNGGKSSVRSVRMWKVAFPETSSTSFSALLIDYQT